MRLTHTRQADLNLLVALTVLLEERQISTAADRFLMQRGHGGNPQDRAASLFFESTRYESQLAAFTNTL